MIGWVILVLAWPFVALWLVMAADNRRRRRNREERSE